MTSDEFRTEDNVLWLVYPAPCYMRDVRGFMSECLNAGERHIQGGGNMEYMQLTEWLEKATKDRSLQSTDSVTSAETFLAYRVEDGALIGCCQLRHHLTDKTKICGGHVGYEVRPSQRGKGYGKLILKAVIEHAKQRGMEYLRLDVDARNIASKRTIEECGGVYTGTDKVGNGGTFQDVMHYNFSLKA